MNPEIIAIYKEIKDYIISDQYGWKLKEDAPIEVKEKYKSMQRYKDVLEVTGARIVPEWLSANHDALSGTVLSKPQRAQIDVPVEETLIVELYSK